MIQLKATIASIQKWWKERNLLHCDYCDCMVDKAWDAYCTPITEYKGPLICMSCIKKLDQTNIIYC